MSQAGWRRPRHRVRYVIEQRREPSICARDTHTEPEPAPYNVRPDDLGASGAITAGTAYPLCAAHAVEWLGWMVEAPVSALQRGCVTPA